MSTFLSYDIEIYDDLPEERSSFDSIRPSIAAICTKEDDLEFFYDEPFMTKETSQRLVKRMMEYQEKGIPALTWNGLSFDFPLLANYSGMVEECGSLALNHIDMMFIVAAQRGHYLSLNSALAGAKLESKVHTVVLNDKTIYSDMSGKQAPELWRKGEYDAIKTYLKGDVLQPLDLASYIDLLGVINWKSKTGRQNALKTKLYTVKECLRFPLPDISWMDTPKLRTDYYSWIPKEVLEKELT